MIMRLEWMGRTLYLRVGAYSLDLGFVLCVQVSTSEARAKDWLRARAEEQLEALVERERKRAEHRRNRRRAA